MGYLHIDNLYKNTTVLYFKTVYALEKVHGTSAHISYHRPGELTFFSGGVSLSHFESLFNRDELVAAFDRLGCEAVTVYGEAYGGACQGMRATYGATLQFIAFDVLINEQWLSVPDMHSVATGLGLEAVPFKLVSTDLETLNAERDAPSEVAQRRGCSGLREGVVLRPPIEVTLNNGARVIAKHKNDAFSERTTPQRVADPAKLAVLSAASEIATEWVTPMRLRHVLDKLPNVGSMEDTRRVIEAMVEDVLREGAGEIVDSKEARGAIGKRTGALFREYLAGRLNDKE